MSATPIPRTLMLSVFGDLDLSLITELPVGRKAIETKIVPPLERTATYDFIRAQIKEGRQAFVICPRIDAAGGGSGKGRAPGGKAAFAKKLELKSVKEEFEKFQRKYSPTCASRCCTAR
jgi:ATP-dependent DNA helicase RecG